jgi:hypothetical protein
MSESLESVSFCTFYNNLELDDDWGVLCSKTHGMKVESCVFSGNSADIRIDDLEEPFQFSNCVFSGAFPSSGWAGTVNCVANSVTPSFGLVFFDTYWCMGQTPIATPSILFLASQPMSLSERLESAPRRQTINAGFPGTWAHTGSSRFVQSHGRGSGELWRTQRPMSITVVQSIDLSKSVAFDDAFQWSASIPQTFGERPSAIVDSASLRASPGVSKTASVRQSGRFAVTLPRVTTGHQYTEGQLSGAIPNTLGECISAIVDSALVRASQFFSRTVRTHLSGGLVVTRLPNIGNARTNEPLPSSISQSDDFLESSAFHSDDLISETILQTIEGDTSEELGLSHKAGGTLYFDFEDSTRAAATVIVLSSAHLAHIGLATEVQVVQPTSGEDSAARVGTSLGVIGGSVGGVVAAIVAAATVLIKWLRREPTEMAGEEDLELEAENTVGAFVEGAYVTQEAPSDDEMRRRRSSVVDFTGLDDEP